MSNTSKERFIAIFLVKSFRKILDTTIKPSNKPSEYTEGQMELAMEFFFGKNTGKPPGIEDKLKILFQEVSKEFLDYLTAEYDKNLPDIVVESISEIEKHISSNYSPEEIDQLFVISQSSVAIKMICDMSLFFVYRKYRNKMYDSLQGGLMDYIDDPIIKDKFQNSVQDLMDNIQNDDLDNNDTENQDPNDIF